ncbi:MAG: hypothetical protein ACI4P7_04135 [Bacilli bacterium]
MAPVINIDGTIPNKAIIILISIDIGIEYILYSSNKLTILFKSNISIN